MDERQRFVRFAVTGGVAAAVNVAARWLVGCFVGYEAAIAIAYLVGMLTAFVLSRAFVFEPSKTPVAVQIMRFTQVNAVAFVQVWLVSIVLAHAVFPAINMTWHAETIAHVIGVSSPLATSFFGHRSYSFR